MNHSEAALLELRTMLSDIDVTADSRLPPERDLAQRLGVQRPALRKALAVLESEGQIWRHVGKGTFVGSRPSLAQGDVSAIARKTHPGEVMRTRILLEPEVAALAALNATPAHVAEMRACLVKCRAAPTWRQYEAWDTRLHRVIAEATQNSMLLALLDTLTAVRRTVTWGRLRTHRERPKPDHHSFGEHEEIVHAIEERDRERARDAMRRHLETVERNLLKT